jgi:membrane protein
MTSPKERLQHLRDRYPWLDHVLRMLSHYGSVNASSQAGAVTYFGFLSFFPILAIAFFVVGIVANVDPDIRGQMTQEINNLLPGVISTRHGDGGVDLDTVGSYSGLAGVVGLAGVLYAGLGWLSGLRVALETVFVVPSYEHPNFLIGKLRDLATLALVGLTLMVSVVLSGAVTGFSRTILGWVGIDSGGFVPTLLLNVLGHALAIAASTVLLLTMFKLLVTESHLPRNAMVRGALLGAVLFEVLKLVANLLLAQTRHSAAFASFGVALILVVWINYFSRFVLYGAAWAYTSPDALAQRQAEARRAPGAAVTVEGAHVDVAAAESANGPVGVQGQPDAAPARPWLVAVGAAVLGALAATAVRGGRS